ncbi:hypothetical protein Bpfe_016907 [Biomphalaria pfeifferi]|uniref:Uncharacterized protein n=1 Tax=Biomphalaria pfeifferi TaxID=112525 RepID=A0AAD8F7V9_BIOPF|nr:hypothetical protein Bpfe_016881 [Biomphalaria pfeifferi]KAK0053662.1 hypothetical protein Bpfe_016882 [Biomphalaria pfeifferi]KAK0053663.1 hypothetical protein Bpfe_016883 [Biomphalaria pfeifferi]KAK0053665.1 hypothetical protein Bpfe_016885 [Biomphalaria pfeifferi]KAK0053669.1 hypothetical protein Bpfe_016889 [Biomphalaria pfeifferi]
MQRRRYGGRRTRRRMKRRREKMATSVKTLEDDGWETVSSSEEDNFGGSCQNQRPEGVKTEDDVRMSTVDEDTLLKEKLPESLEGDKIPDETSRLAEKSFTRTGKLTTKDFVLTLTFMDDKCTSTQLDRTNETCRTDGRCRFSDRLVFWKANGYTEVEEKFTPKLKVDAWTSTQLDEPSMHAWWKKLRMLADLEQEKRNSQTERRSTSKVWKGSKVDHIDEDNDPAPKMPQNRMDLFIVNKDNCEAENKCEASGQRESSIHRKKEKKNRFLKFVQVLAACFRPKH